MTFEKIQSVIPGMLTWAASTPKGNFVICADAGDFTVSYKPFPGARTQHIVGFDNPLPSLDEAKAACEQFYENN